MQGADPPRVEPTPTPPPVISIDERPYHAVIQYGTSEVIKHNSGPLYTYIRYPQGGNPTDEFISNWARNLYFDINQEFLLVRETESGAIGEINVHFDSYLIDNRYVGILQEGEYSLTLDPSIVPEEILKIFNLDLSNNSFLESTQILDYSKSDSIIELLRNRTILEYPDTERHLGFVDMSWLKNVVIGNQGILVVLDKSSNLLPDMFDTLIVTLPYENLSDELLIRREPPLEVAPTPRPTPGQEDTTDPSEDDPDDSEPSVPPQTGRIDPSRPIIALTFDDGPGHYTDQFLDLFEKYGIRATFCVIGNLVNTQEDALARAVSLGNEVIGHSWDHKNLAKLTEDAAGKQITDTYNVIFDVTGTELKLFRPPYGAVNDSLRDISKELGFSMIYWTVDPEDWDTHDSDAVFHAVMNRVSNGSIILSHEIYKSTLVAYQRLIPELLSHGYQFVTVTELLNMHYNFDVFEPGEVYPMIR